MLQEIKNKINRSLHRILQNLDKTYGLRRISPFLFKNLKQFITRDGKRLRPVLFSLSYLGFSKKPAHHYMTCALSLELLHDFIIIHDDIIDKAGLRRGKPSLHIIFEKYLSMFRHAKFNGKDFSLIAGDLMYSLGLRCFLSIEEHPLRKQKALFRLVDGAIRTGSGQLAELLLSLKPLDSVKKKDIYRVYDLKTAYYTFYLPLVLGAILSGQKVTPSMEKCGLMLGRAFQIKDDIIDIFGKENKTGKSSLSDIRESKRTLLVWSAYRQSSAASRKSITKILCKEKPDKKDLEKIKDIIVSSGSLEKAKKEIIDFRKQAKKLIRSFRMKKEIKGTLSLYCEELLRI
ncbi:MAG: polyprenyl synthetase family protein [Candidatus Aureabacteria bacterium]|nr:polyprenyl synthetase family protein [Candidatus Auribacterota bacterium]